MNKEQLIELDNAIRSWLLTLDQVIPNLIGEMETSTKHNRFDLVTNVDKTIQLQFQQFLNDNYPDHQLLAEEKSNDEVTPKEGHVWIMDPIDGTTNLVKQQEDYCIILGYFVDGVPTLSYIYDYPHQQLHKAVRGYGAYTNGEPITPPETMDLADAIISFNSQVMNNDTINDLYDAAFSYRFIGSCGLDSVRVIQGQFGAHINTNPKPWDIAAQFLFAEELGLTMTTLSNTHLDYATSGPFIISNPGCHEEILQIINSGNGYAKY
ncbi:inositol monophosphatase family protein [Staphylococcus arlettae]|uniref:inositol monophosphatase family protein n=1 Tax=Staphylococcus arlettae TaxID=29378 RepID=UPI000282373B|nr:inositol monophosphatase family protein [Staphylococcus arlettae]EJY95612.1 inositol monophosphatase [Staphylococcus arlettae CVD059]MCD9054742.1 inositol monophosphatase family protein [Staphylococcus arlettae]MDT3893843.1 inositol monophosphatase family protein [Staphylococcus arlettae]UXU50513.1 inositol monophosphatase family protein [Staphylococcus arlettae]BBK27491.1 inositol monophosphatase [Staphylococcus arlettae]